MTLIRRATFFLLSLGIALSVLPTFAQTTPIMVYRSDFIPDGSRSHFNSFEAIPHGPYYYYPSSQPYVEDGIAVQQVNGYTENVWVTYFHPDGNFGWYPYNGGGYTRITRPDGSDFFDVGFFYTTGLEVAQTDYELYRDGMLVLRGTLGRTMNGMTFYAGFSGGGFDEIRMWDEGGVRNFLALDAIELRDGVARSSRFADVVRTFLAFLAAIILFLTTAPPA